MSSERQRTSSRPLTVGRAVTGSRGFPLNRRAPGTSTGDWRRPRRGFDIHTREAGQNGTAEVVGSLDLGDALDLETAIHVHTHDPDQARCETTRTPISVNQVAGWCTNPDTEVVIAPVIDLNEHVHVDRYERPDRMWDQAVERDMTPPRPAGPWACLLGLA